MIEVLKNFSGRKILALVAAFIFTFSCIGYLFNLRELPGSYTAIIGLVFTYYFTKEVLNKIKLTNKKEEE